MPRHYKCKRFAALDLKCVEECLVYIEVHGESVNAAAQRFSLSEATVRRHRKVQLEDGYRASIGRLPSLPSGTQAELAKVAKISARHGFGQTKEQVQQLIGKYVQKN